MALLKSALRNGLSSVVALQKINLKGDQFGSSCNQIISLQKYIRCAYKLDILVLDFFENTYVQRTVPYYNYCGNLGEEELSLIKQRTFLG